MPCACGILLANAALRSLPLASPPLAPAPAALHRFGRDPNCGRPTSTEWERTGALASEGVVEGAVEEAGVRMVRCGARPCRAHRILCLCPGEGAAIGRGAGHIVF